MWLKAPPQGLMSLTSDPAVPGQTTPPSNGNGKKRLTTLGAVTVRFAGDSGDGMQLAGTQFTDTSALVGNDISTLPDFPAEVVDALTAGQIRNGRDFRISPFHVRPGGRFVKAVNSDGQLVAIGEARLPHLYHPVLVL